MNGFYSILVIKTQSDRRKSFRLNIKAIIPDSIFKADFPENVSNRTVRFIIHFRKQHKTSRERRITYRNSPYPEKIPHFWMRKKKWKTLFQRNSPSQKPILSCLFHSYQEYEKRDRTNCSPENSMRTRISGLLQQKTDSSAAQAEKNNIRKGRKMVGVRGFEPPASTSRT